MQLIQRRHTLCRNAGLSFLPSCHIQLIQRRQTLSEWRCLGLLYTSAIYKSEMEASLSLSLLYNCYMHLIQGRQALCQNGGFLFLYNFHLQLILRRQIVCQNGNATTMYNSYTDGKHFARMEASQLSFTTHTEGIAPFLLELASTTYTEKEDIVKMKVSLSLLYSCHLQFIQRKHIVWQNGGLPVFCPVATNNLYREYIHSVSMEIPLPYTTHTENACTLSEWWSLSLSLSLSFSLYLCYAIAICNSSKENSHSINMEASCISIQLPYTTGTVKADTLAEWKPFVSAQVP